ncbi:WD40 repeat-like protein [Trametes coccinea BRFM310]|uniref:WD40 repeat-like protein n=1 Tax=Trametes coccinea (strain BRFM310) TaxID=1353009 RepID=A0A1Y2II14_TRAC3|nr:WD40 repeat-like protein [Trametes coccinea BRFM310]
MPPLPPIYEIYSRQLLPAQYGLPLWDAELEDNKYEVEIGTVGRIESGKFWRLFNAAKPADDPDQKHGVPSDYEPLNILPRRLDKWEVLKQPLLYSATVKSRDLEATLNAGSPDGNIMAGGSAKFVCKENTGAFLLHTPPAKREKMSNKSAIVNYMRYNFDHWLEFANGECGMMLSQDQLYFVHGTVKTSRWACAAFHGNCRNREGSVQAQLLNAGLNLSISLSSEDSTRLEYNFGPTTGTNDRDPFLTSTSGSSVGTQTIGVAEEPPKRDQCIFLNYFKAKKRLFFARRLMEAAAGAHELPPADHDDTDTNDPVAAQESWSSGSDSEFEEGPQSAKMYDPVDFLLDYIIEHSNAEMAIACDTDLFALFQNIPFPVDIPAAILEIRPPIHVDESGAGTISVDHSVAEEPLRELSDLRVKPQAEPEPLTQTYVDLPSGFWNDTPAPTSPSPRSEDEPDNEGGLAEEEARLRREAKQAALPWQPAAAGHTGAVTSLTYSHDSKLLATGSDDGSIIIWDTSDQSVIRRWDAHMDVIWSLVFSPDDKRLASASADTTAMVWSVETDEQLATMQGHEDVIRAMAWSSDGKTIGTGSDDLHVNVWDADIYELKHRMQAGHAFVTYVKFSHNSRWLASTSADFCCRIWNVETGDLHKSLEGHEGIVWFCDFDLEDRRIATCADDATARIWNVETGELLLDVHQHLGPVWNVLFSPPDGKRVLTVSNDMSMNICDSYTGSELVELEGHESVIHTGCFSPDGKYVASASADYSVRLWRAEDGKLLLTFNEHEDKVTMVMFGPDGNTLTSGADDGTVRIRTINEWDPDRAKLEDEDWRDCEDDEDEDEDENDGDTNVGPGEGEGIGKGKGKGKEKARWQSHHEEDVLASKGNDKGKEQASD